MESQCNTSFNIQVYIRDMMNTYQIVTKIFIRVRHISFKNPSFIYTCTHYTRHVNYGTSTSIISYIRR